MSKRSDRFASQFRNVDGWIELGDDREANEALGDIEPQLRATVEGLERREKIYAALGKAELLDVVGRQLYPSKP